MPPRFTEHLVERLANDRIAGCALDGATLVTWGSRLLSRRLPQSPAQVLRPAGPFSQGGCLMDVDGDGQPEIVVNENGPERALVWFQPPLWTRHVIDTGMDAPDILPATLYGRRGLLLIQKRIQIRFYEIPADPTSRWVPRDVYSVYTPSWQGGLRLADIDGDGRPDLLCGNYWVRSPAGFELPWRLFAINTWTEQKKSGMMRLVYASLFAGAAPVLLAVQRAMDHARLAWFVKPPDPRHIWEEHRIDCVPDLAEPGSLDVADFDGDGRPEILIAEKAGAGRLLILHNAGSGRFEPHVLRQGSPVDHAQAIYLHASRRPDILVIARDGISWWENGP